MMVWVDVETTGLDPKTDRLLEVAVIVTDDDLIELGSFHALLCYWMDQTDHDDVLRRVDDVVLEMHHESGLWDDLASSDDLMSYSECDARLSQFLGGLIDREGVAPKDLPPLAGSTVSFDRGFMRAFLPQSLTFVSHRHVDVSTVKELAKRWCPRFAESHGPDVREDRVPHRALSDIEDSIDAMQHFKVLFDAVP